MQFNKWIVGVVVIVISITLGFVLCLWLNKPQVINNPVPIYIQGKDSLVIEKHYYAIHDTIEADIKDDTAKAVFNTERIFDKDTLKVETQIRYTLLDSAFSINQYFDFINTKEFRVDTLKIEVPTEVMVYKEIPIWESPYISFVLGLITAVTIFLLSGG